MASQIFRPGATAVISGGASGVGFAMANLLRSHGMHLCLLDRNEAALSDAKAVLQSHPATATHPGIKTEVHTLDVGDLDSWNKLKPKILSDFPTIDVLLLNAGTSLKPTTSQSYEDVNYFQQTLATNMFGVINGLATLLSAVQATAKAKAKAEAAAEQQSKQAIIITGSKQGITNPPGAANPAYNMSKSALKTLAEHLSYDLRTPGNPSYSPNISVHLLIPGWTFTGLSGNPGPIPVASTLAKKSPGAWLPEQVARYAEAKISQEGQFYIVCPDGDVDEALDEARMSYAVGDVVEGRPALSRWHDDFKDDAAAWIGAEAERRRGLKTQKIPPSTE